MSSAATCQVLFGHFSIHLNPSETKQWHQLPVGKKQQKIPVTSSHWWRCQRRGGGLPQSLTAPSQGTRETLERASSPDVWACKHMRTSNGPRLDSLTPPEGETGVDMLQLKFSMQVTQESRKAGKETPKAHLLIQRISIFNVSSLLTIVPTGQTI